jgi:hypothetical protein
LLSAWIIFDDNVDGFEEDLIDTSHLLAAAFHVTSSHSLSNSHSLLLSDGGQPLSFEKVDTSAFCSKVGLEADEDDWGVRTEM